MSDIIPYQQPSAAPPDLEHVNLFVAMAGLSVHTQRAIAAGSGATSPRCTALPLSRSI